MTADMHLESAFQYLDRAEALHSGDPAPTAARRDAAEARAGHLASMATAHFLAARAMGLQ